MPEEPKQLDECELDALLGRCKRGDDEAWREVVEEYEEPIFRFLAKLTGNEADAEDLLQETWKGVVRNLDSFRGECRFLNWCYSIAYRRFCDWLRHRKVEHINDHVPIDEADSEGAGVGFVLVDPESEKRKRYAVVFDVLERISPECRTLLDLHYVVGLSYDEIAVLRGMPVSTVGKRLLRCRQRARELAEES